MHPIPVEYDEKTRTVTKYPEHVTETRDGLGVPTIEDVSRWLKEMRNPNGMALKLWPPFGMFDFDIKNTDDKELFNKFMHIVESTDDEVLRKVCIETTRNGGYHLYIKYKGLSHKMPLARGPGGEVISVYTGGLLSFANPTPHYSMFHNDFGDLEELTNDEFELLVSCAAYFNIDAPDGSLPIIPGDQRKAEYPSEYESAFIQFDEKCSDDAFHQIITSIGLHSLGSDQRFLRKKYTAYLRLGSNAAYSAKAYFRSKTLLIFSGSMTDFPNFQSRLSAEDHNWRLSPGFILYYKNKRSWPAALAEAQALAKEYNVEIAPSVPVTEQDMRFDERLIFPYDIFPESIINYIRINQIQHEYMAGAALAAMSAAMGNSVVLEANDGYMVRPILYLAIVAPPGASKTPALKSIFYRLEKEDGRSYAQHSEAVVKYNEELAVFKNRKKGGEEPPPAEPKLRQILIKDATIEKVIDIMTSNPEGCCILADELSGFLNRMGRYSEKSDEVQKWLEMWSGSPVVLQRVFRGSQRVEKPFCTVVGGIQPGVLDMLSRQENRQNGFYHRFLFVYPDVQRKKDWNLFVIPDIVKIGYEELFANLMKSRSTEVRYELSVDANDMYARWFNHKNTYYNKSNSDDVRGIIAKYQDYCLRFALILQVAHEAPYRYGIVHEDNMDRAIRLTEYFLGNMHKATRVLNPETPIDKLLPPYTTLYQKLPVAFTTNTAMELGATLGIKAVSCRVFLNRNVKILFQQISRGKYEKMY